MPAPVGSFGSRVGSCLYRRDAEAQRTAEKGQKERPALSPRGLAEGPNHGAPLRSPNPQSAKPGKGAFSSTSSALISAPSMRRLPLSMINFSFGQLTSTRAPLPTSGRRTAEKAGERLPKLPSPSQ